MKMILTNYYQGIVAERESKEKYTDSSSIGHRDFPSARATEDHLFLGSRSCLCACQSAASEWTRTRRKKTGEEEGRGPRSRERARWNEADKASYRGGAGPDGIALPVSCLSRHVLASPTRNRLGYLDDSFLVLVPIQGERGGSWPRLPSSPPGLQGPRPMSLVLTSSPSLFLPPSADPLFPPSPPFLFEVVDRQTGRSEKSREDSARSSCATRLYNRIVSNDGYEITSPRHRVIHERNRLGGGR